MLRAYRKEETDFFEIILTKDCETVKHKQHKEF